LENDGWGGGRTFVYPPGINQQADIYEDNDQSREAIEDASTQYWY
jgi:hypothetical protein